MAASNSAKLPKRDIWIDCGRYFVRTIKVSDASSEWAGWMDDPKNLRLVNSAPAKMTKQDIVAYIKKFDQRSHLLVGMFEKGTLKHFGFFRIDIDPVLKRCLLFMMTGERAFRHIGVINGMRVPFYDYLFDVLGLETLLATALQSNFAMARFLRQTGWSLDKIAKNEMKSHSNDDLLDICYFSLKRDAWRAWRQNHIRKHKAETEVGINASNRKTDN